MDLQPLFIRVWLAVCMMATLGILALPTGLIPALMIAGFVAAASVLGSAFGRLINLDDPFLEYILGFVALTYLAWLALALLPTHRALAAALILLSVFLGSSYFLKRPGRIHKGAGSPPWPTAVTAVMVALNAGLWNYDNHARLEAFQHSGHLDFWVDIFVHTSRLVQLGGEFGAGRGYALLVDFPAPLYHLASYAVPSLLLVGTNASPLAIATLIWIPLGSLVMASGVAALGQALGGRWAAFWTMPALALVPILDRLPLFDPDFSMPWLVEAGPGAYYGLGVACAMMALLVLWMRTGREGLLAAAVAMLLSMFFIRVNFFLWLAPFFAMAAIYEPAGRLCGKLGVRPIVLLLTGTAALILILALLSWKDIINDRSTFVLGYVFRNSIVPAVQIQNGLLKTVLILLSAIPILVAMQGLWLPLMVIQRLRLRQLNALQPWDNMPFLLMLVAAVFLFLGPMPTNGDIAEFRHRGAPLLLIVTMVWSVHFMVLIFTPAVERMPAATRQSILIACCLLPFIGLVLTIPSARAPRMAWGQELFGRTFSPQLQQVADALREEANRSSRFAVAGASPDARLFDDAAVIVAESGVPAFFSCPQPILLRHDAYGDDARSRIVVQQALDQASSASALRDVMASNAISHYVVLGSSHASFDKDRHLATWAKDGWAVYSERDLARKLAN